MERGRPHRVAVVVLPGVIPLEFGTATQVFGRDPHYQLIVCAENRAASAPRYGFVINTSSGLGGIKRADTVIVPGYDDVDATVSHSVLDAVRVAHGRGARLVSICTGAFALAAAGSSTDVPRQPTGDGPMSCNAATPTSPCYRTACSSTTATS